MTQRDQLGANLANDGKCTFLLWAPRAHGVEVHLVSPGDRLVALNRVEGDYYHGQFHDVSEGAKYRYRIDGKSEFPDPASRFQPDGVHGPSMVVNPAFPWGDEHWRGLPLQDYITYELHVGTFTPEGTFEAMLDHLDGLADLGINAVELMPVAQFPGGRNWGYDGVAPFAVQNSYGGPGALKRLVDECHKRGMAVILDVVYNHLGPEGNYLEQYGYYFTDRYHTTWGKALNFDGPYSDEVRRFFIENACRWIEEFHFDALRLDALHAIIDSSSFTFLEELSTAIDAIGRRLDRRVYLIGESDANDRRLITPIQDGGYGIDAQWNEGFHHALHAILTGEREGYYEDFGEVADLAKAFREGFVYSGQYSPYRKRRHGTSTIGIPAERFVAFSQNHDQVGNRMLGNRLAGIVPFEALKLAAATVLLSPYLPLIFMGEEYGETAPFLYFTSHIDAALVKAVREGRAKEFSVFGWKGTVPDPQDEATFTRSHLDHDIKSSGKHAVILDFYKELIKLRREVPALRHLSKQSAEVLAYDNKRVLSVRRWHGDSHSLAVFNFGEKEASMDLPVPPGIWKKRVDSAGEQWLGTGSRIPQEIESRGEMDISIPTKSLVLFTS